MIFGYRRVSTKDQTFNRQDIEGCDRIFEEYISGGQRKRPELDRMIEMLRPGDTVRVHAIDRLARSLFDLLDLIRLFNERGVTVEFRKEGLTFGPDHTDPMGRLQLQLMGAIAEFERNLINARSAEGREKARAEGRSLGGRKQSIDRRLVMDLLAAGHTPTKVARTLNINRDSVYRIMKEQEAQKGA